MLSALAYIWLGDSFGRINSQPAPKYATELLANGSFPSPQKTSTEQLSCCFSSLAPCSGWGGGGGRVKGMEWRCCLSLWSPGPAEHRGMSRCSAISPRPICKKKMRSRKGRERLPLPSFALIAAHTIIRIITAGWGAGRVGGELESGPCLQSRKNQACDMMSDFQPPHCPTDLIP